MANNIHKEFILCAAIGYKGVITPGFRHSDCIAIIMQIETTKPQLLPGNYGFLTSCNRFVSRRQAFRIAKEQGQITSYAKDYVDYELLSEDLY